MQDILDGTISCSMALEAHGDNQPKNGDLIDIRRHFVFNVRKNSLKEPVSDGNHLFRVVSQIKIPRINERQL